MSRRSSPTRTRVRAGFAFALLLLTGVFVAPAFAQPGTSDPPPPPPTTGSPTTTRPAPTTATPTTTIAPTTTIEATTTTEAPPPPTQAVAAAQPVVTRTTTTTRPTTTSVTTTVASTSSTTLKGPSAVVSAPTTTIDKVINSSAGSKVRSAVRSLEIIAGATGVLTLLYWWNTRPRRRVRLAQIKAQQQAALTQEAREIYADAVSGASVFADADEPTGELVAANAGRGEAPSREDLPLAARLPRAMSGPVAQSPAELTTSDPLVVDEPSQSGAERPPARPNPRPSPRRNRAMRSRQALTGDAIVKDDD